MSSPCFEPAVDLAADIRTGDRSPVDVVTAYLDRIESRNDATNAYVTVAADEARAAAREAEQAAAAGEDLGPLHGVPVAIKDLAPTAGIRTTFGAAPFAEFVPESDALPVERLREAGAVVLGKTNTPTFGYKGTTDNPVFGPTATPFDHARNAGGSSGGSAAAVADGLAPIAHGTDGGGSLRIPASACGIYALKPTFARVPSADRPDAFGHAPFADHGPLARTVDDAALMLDVMAGPHPRDPFALPDDGSDYVAATDRPIDDLSVAYSPDLGLFPVAERVRGVVDEAVEAFADAGADVERADPAFDRDREALLDGWLTGFRVLLATLNENLAADGTDLLGDHRADLDAALVEHMEAGQEVSAVEYKRADVVRTAVLDAVADLLAEYDLLVSPTLAVPSVDLDSDGPTEVAGEQVNPLYGWFLTWPFNMTGHPAASLPAGRVGDNPVGLQVVGPRFGEETVLAASAAVERERPWDHLYPPSG